jgi:hypothetical protein
MQISAVSVAPFPILDGRPLDGLSMKVGCEFGVKVQPKMEESITMHDLVVGQCSLIDLIPTVSLGELDVNQEKVQVQRGCSLVDRLGKGDQCQTACIIASDKQALQGDHLVTARTAMAAQEHRHLQDYSCT